MVLYIRKYLYKETHPVISMPSGPVLKEIFYKKETHPVTSVPSGPVLKEILIQKKPTPSPLCPVVLYLKKYQRACIMPQVSRALHSSFLASTLRLGLVGSGVLLLGDFIPLHEETANVAWFTAFRFPSPWPHRRL